MAKAVKKAAPKKKAKTPKIPRKRAKKVDGTFEADDPKTPDVNEAFVDDHRLAQRATRSQTGSRSRRLGGKLVD
jgi:hypothetical protein